ncbi:MAG: hypothetical protein WDA42_06690 [Candidatus Bathyarchaeia archaeon]
MNENILTIVILIFSALLYYGIYRLCRFILTGGLKFTRSKSLFPAQGESIPSLTSDELYQRVAEELRQNSIRQGLWAKAFAEADGDKAKTQAAYIRYRVAELQKNLRPTDVSIDNNFSENTTKPNQAVPSGGPLFGLLRFIRGICGFIFALQVIHMVEAATTLLKPEAVSVDMGSFFALLFVKVIFLAVAGFLFFWLRGLINRMHTEKHGTPHPSLAEKKWAL